MRCSRKLLDYSRKTKTFLLKQQHFPFQTTGFSFYFLAFLWISKEVPRFFQKTVYTFIYKYAFSLPDKRICSICLMFCSIIRKKKCSFFKIVTSFFKKRNKFLYLLKDCLVLFAKVNAFQSCCCVFPNVIALLPTLLRGKSISLHNLFCKLCSVVQKSCYFSGTMLDSRG